MKNEFLKSEPLMVSKLFSIQVNSIISCNKPKLRTKFLKDMFIYTDALIQVVIQDINYISRWSRSSSITVFWLAWPHHISYHIHCKTYWNLHTYIYIRTKRQQPKVINLWIEKKNRWMCFLYAKLMF